MGNLWEVNNSGVVQLAVLASDPGTPVEGQMYYNSTDKVIKIYDGTAFVDAGSREILGASSSQLFDTTSYSDGGTISATYWTATATVNSGTVSTVEAVARQALDPFTDTPAPGIVPSFRLSSIGADMIGNASSSLVTKDLMNGYDQVMVRGTWRCQETSNDATSQIFFRFDGTLLSTVIPIQFTDAEGTFTIYIARVATDTYFIQLDVSNDGGGSQPIQGQGYRNSSFAGTSTPELSFEGSLAFVSGSTGVSYCYITSIWRV